ncbi:MAG: tetratricopeptide repeat protein [Treponema sp.]|nr:tetratricopeptide repeat protein [Treponema sp.]
MERKGILLITLFFSSCILFADINADALRCYNEGINYYNTNDFDSAILEFTNAITIFPEYADAYLERGNCYDNKGDQENALENYLRAGEYDSKYLIFAHGYECASDNIQNYDEAIVVFSQCIDLKINLFIAYCMRGNSYGEKYEFDNAAADYTEAIKISPNIFQPYFSRGTLNMVLGNFEQAIDDLEMSIELCPDYVIAYFYLSLLYEIYGNSSKSKEVMMIYENIIQKDGS